MMKAKVESQVMQKASPTSFNLRPHQLLNSNNSNKPSCLQQHQVQQLIVVSAETEPARADVLEAVFSL